VAGDGPLKLAQRGEGGENHRRRRGPPVALARANDCRVQLAAGERGRQLVI